MRARGRHTRRITAPVQPQSCGWSYPSGPPKAGRTGREGIITTPRGEPELFRRGFPSGGIGKNAVTARELSSCRCGPRTFAST